MKKILIAGQNSYIGTSLQRWLMKQPTRYQVDTMGMKDGAWTSRDFSGYDVIVHVAAIVHQKEDASMEEVYDRVNRELPLRVAERAKAQGVKQFIFLSTMAVYGEEGKIGQNVVINRATPTNPKTLYAMSKLAAEQGLNEMADDRFRVTVLRPPMVYGPECPGNYARLEKLASKVKVFPSIDNKRSVVHIDKLCQHMQQRIDDMKSGVYFPQDAKYMNTSLTVKRLAQHQGRTVYLSKVFGWVVRVAATKVDMLNKAFGNLTYEQEVVSAKPTIRLSHWRDPWQEKQPQWGKELKSWKAVRRTGHMETAGQVRNK